MPQNFAMPGTKLQKRQKLRMLTSTIAGKRSARGWLSRGSTCILFKTLVGHESIKTTERYAHHCPSSLRPSVRAVDDYNNITTAEAVND